MTTAARIGLQSSVARLITLDGFFAVLVMATAANYEVSFDVDVIDSLYINAAIYEMNQKTERAIWELSQRISELYAFIHNVTSLMSTYQPQELIDFMSTMPKINNWPVLPQILPVDKRDTGKQRKAAKRDDSELISEMRQSVKETTQITSDLIPLLMTDQTYDLIHLQKVAEDGARKLNRVENFKLNHIYYYGQWLLAARESFRDAKSKNELLFWSNNFIDWLDERCNLKKTRAYDYIKFVDRFSMFPGILRCQLPFHWFKTNGGRICNYLQANEEEGRKWQT